MGYILWTRTNLKKQIRKVSLAYRDFVDVKILEIAEKLETKKQKVLIRKVCLAYRGFAGVEIVEIAKKGEKLRS